MRGRETYLLHLITEEEGLVEPDVCLGTGHDGHQTVVGSTVVLSAQLKTKALTLHVLLLDDINSPVDRGGRKNMTIGRTKYQTIEINKRKIKGDELKPLYNGHGANITEEEEKYDYHT